MNGFKCSCGHEEYRETPCGNSCNRCELELTNIDEYNIKQYEKNEPIMEQKVKMNAVEKLKSVTLMTGVYAYKGDTYTAFGVIEVKTPISGEWFLGVHYVAHNCSNKDETMGMYCRDIEDFISKFKYIGEL